MRKKLVRDFNAPDPHAHLRGIGDQWPGQEGPHGPMGVAGASYMMASAPAGGQTYTAEILGIK
jgi:hypothetical protein